MNKIPDIMPDDESLEKEAPLLHSLPKENPFSVPPSYFDSLPSEIIEKCRKEGINSKPSVFAKNLKSFLLSYKWKLLAATACLAIICFFTTRLNNRPISYQAMAQNIPDSLIIQHLDKDIATINESTLEDLQQPEDSLVSIKNNSDSSGADQDIIAYLMNHNVNVSDIENEP